MANVMKPAKKMLFHIVLHFILKTRGFGKGINDFTLIAEN